MALFIVLAIGIAAAGHAQTSVMEDVRGVSASRGADAEGCVITPLACNRTARGHLGTGDCTLSSDGTYFDGYSFAGTAGQLVLIDVRPLSATLTNPTVFLVPPAGDASKTPLLAGPGGGVSLAYVLSSSGTWTVVVGTLDLFASGDYFVSIRCVTDSDPTAPQNCTYQNLLCGQTGAWNLTSQSCRFGGSGANRLFAPFEIDAVAGDVLKIEEASNDFRPLFGVYDRNGNLLASSASATNTSTSLTFFVPTTGLYELFATSTTDLTTGFFTLRVNCSGSGCLEPLELSPMQPVTVPYGGQATLSFNVSATEPLAVNWTQVSPDFGSLLTMGRTIVTSPLFATSSFFATATNPCGTTMSTTVTVNVQPARLRPARH